MTTYLDNAATSFPKPEAVYAAMDRCARLQPAGLAGRTIIRGSNDLGKAKTRYAKYAGH